jgi:hypothetical protein
LENILADFGAELLFDLEPALGIRARHFFFSLISNCLAELGGTDSGASPEPLRAVPITQALAVDGKKWHPREREGRECGVSRFMTSEDDYRRWGLQPRATILNATWRRHAEEKPTDRS